MKLLLDANLSWRMIPALKTHFDDCFHVDQIGLRVPSKDKEIWEYAKTMNLVIVTNDEDFIDLMNIAGFPPKVVLLKTGNQSKETIIDLLIFHKDQIRSFYDTSNSGVLEIIHL